MLQPLDKPLIRWLALAAVIAVYLAAVLQLHPANFFGATQDDTIYFASARALAQGQGYVLPSLPGAPAATKYPILYPWILSGVWRWNPSFPSNLRDAIAIAVAFGIAYIALSFAFLRRLDGIGNLEALLLTAFCALQPVFLFYSSTVNSDLPFAAIGLAALLLADRATEPNASAGSTALCGVTGGLAMLVRFLGVPVAAGILASALLRRAWRQAAILVCCTAAPFAWLLWESTASVRVPRPADFNTAGPGFQQTWIYYTSYLGFRKLSAVNAHIALTMLGNQVTYLLVELPGYFLSPLFRKSIILLFVSSWVILWMIFAGMVREAHGRWRPVHFAFLCTIGVILVWDYPEVRRFLILFFPFAAAAVWLEGKHWAVQLLQALRSPLPRTSKLLATAALVNLAFFAAGVGWNFLTNQERTDQRRASADRAALLGEKLEGYDWIRRNTPMNTRAVAGEDASFYLYTGRQAMAPIALRQAGAYYPAYMREDLTHLKDTATAIGASYWFASSDDSSKEWFAAKPFLAQSLSEVEKRMPEVFRSSGGRVRIYDASCLRRREASPCGIASDPPRSAVSLNTNR